VLLTACSRPGRSSAVATRWRSPRSAGAASRRSAAWSPWA